MTITMTTPRILGYRMFLQVEKYPLSGQLLDCVKDECDTEIWLLGFLYLVVSNEKVERKQVVVSQ